MDDKELEALAEISARVAVKKTYAILGVNIDDPKEVENFRRDLRFAGDLRRYAAHGTMAFVAAFALAAGALLWAGFKSRFGG